MRKLPFPLEKQSIVSKLYFFKEFHLVLTSFSLSLFFSDDRTLPSNSRPTVNIGLLKIGPQPQKDFRSKKISHSFALHCRIEKWPLIWRRLNQIPIKEPN